MLKRGRIEMLGSKVEEVCARRRSAERRLAASPVVPIVAACILVLFGVAIAAALLMR